MKPSPSSSLSSPSNFSLSSSSSDLLDRLTAVTTSISFGTGTDQGFIDLGQDPSLSILSGDGMAPPAMRVQSTESVHGGKQLLGDPTDKSVNVSELLPRFTSIREGIKVALLINDISQGDVGNFEDTSAGLETTTILPRLLVSHDVVAAPSVSFCNDIAGNIGDNAFGGVLEINLRD